ISTSTSRVYSWGESLRNERLADDHIHLVYGGQPNQSASDEPVATITGAAPEMSKRDVLWGLLEDARQQEREEGAFFSSSFLSFRVDLFLRFDRSSSRSRDRSTNRS